MEVLLESSLPLAEARADDEDEGEDDNEEAVVVVVLVVVLLVELDKTVDSPGWIALPLPLSLSFSRLIEKAGMSGRSLSSALSLRSV